METFAAKVKAIAETTDKGVVRKPEDLNVMVAATFIHSSVEAFRIPAITLYNQLQIDHDCMHWMDILENFVDNCTSLDGDDRWPPTKAVQKSGDTATGTSEDSKKDGCVAHIHALQKQLKETKEKLAKRNSNSSNRTQSTGTSNNRSCFRCGSKDHLIKDCPQSASSSATKPNPKTIPPKEGEKHTKLIDDVLHKWCSKCDENGLWRAVDRGGHYTSEHKTREQLQKARESRREAVKVAIETVSEEEASEDEDSVESFCRPVGKLSFTSIMIGKEKHGTPSENIESVIDMFGDSDATVEEMTGRHIEEKPMKQVNAPKPLVLGDESLDSEFENEESKESAGFNQLPRRSSCI